MTAAARSGCTCCRRCAGGWSRCRSGSICPYWVEDPDFDLDFHIRETAVPPPGDDRQLAETVARIFARPLDRGRPLWELYLIHGLSDGRVALLTKIHHSVVDGVSGNEIMAVLLDPEPDGPRDPAAGTPPPAPTASRATARCSRAACAASRASRCARCARSPTTVAGFTELPGANALPGVPTLSRVYSRVRRAARRRRSTRACSR